MHIVHEEQGPMGYLYLQSVSYLNTEGAELAIPETQQEHARGDTIVMKSSTATGARQEISSVPTVRGVRAEVLLVSR